MSHPTIVQALQETLGCSTVSPTPQEQGGLNRCLTYDTDKGKYFVKTNTKDLLGMFAAEAKGLQCLANTCTIRVPRPYYYGTSDQESFLILEYIPLQAHNPVSQKLLGEQVARMHLTQTSRVFGFDIDNTIGTTPQINQWCNSWVPFFAQHRLQYQLDLCHDVEVAALGEELLAHLPKFFEGITIRPSLLHGDLWGGNTAADEEGNPVVYDPACYYGHHEAELSIVQMFGGFSREFFEAYHAYIPKEPGFEERQKIYQLYHYLNHYHLFGSSYRGACLSLLHALKPAN